MSSESDFKFINSVGTLSVVGGKLFLVLKKDYFCSGVKWLEKKFY